MWLDRLSGHSPSASPPPALNRSHSPAPGRSNHLAPSVAGRPSYGPRSSSLGLGSKPNASTTSLSSPRLPNGSSLRQQIVPPPDISDPLEVLESIIGKGLDRKVNGFSADNSRPLQKPTQLVQNVEFNGSSLLDFAAQTEEAKENEAQHANAETVKECE